MFTRLTVLGKDERMSVVDTVRTRQGLEVSRPSTVRLSSMPQGQDMLAIAIRVDSRYSNEFCTDPHGVEKKDARL